MASPPPPPTPPPPRPDSPPPPTPSHLSHVTSHTCRCAPIRLRLQLSSSPPQRSTRRQRRRRRRQSSGWDDARCFLSPSTQFSPYVTLPVFPYLTDTCFLKYAEDDAAAARAEAAHATLRAELDLQKASLTLQVSHCMSHTACLPPFMCSIPNSMCLILTMTYYYYYYSEHDRRL